MTNIGLTLTHPNNQLLEQFIDERTEIRHSKNKHILYNQFPDIREISERVFWGMFTWTMPNSKRRLLVKNTAIRTGKLVMSAGDIVRDYLDFYHPAKLRCIGAEARDFLKPISAPLYVRPSIIQRGVYIDIESTYFSILKLIGWDCAYKRGKWVTAGRAPIDFPLPAHKGARNYLVSVGLNTPMTIWNGKEFIFQQGNNKHINMALWHLVQDILHSIATTAIELGAVYVHTDGYIIDETKAEKLISVIKDWGLNGRVLGEGESIVLGVGNYWVGDKKSKAFDYNRVQKPFCKIEQTDGSWLQRQVQKLAVNKTAARLCDQRGLEYNVLTHEAKSGKVTNERNSSCRTSN